MGTKYRVKIDDKDILPRISAMILQKMKADAGLSGEPITQAVITVPAYFTDARGRRRKSRKIEGKM